MLIRNASKPVMHGFYAASCQVAVGIECIKMRTDSSVFPFPFSRNAHSTIVRRCSYCYDVEAFFQMLEWFVSKYCFTSSLGVFVEGFHFIFGISFSHDSEINTFFGCTVLKQIAVRSYMRCTALVNKDIIRIDFMRE